MIRTKEKSWKIILNKVGGTNWVRFIKRLIISFTYYKMNNWLRVCSRIGGGKLPPPTPPPFPSISKWDICLPLLQYLKARDDGGFIVFDFYGSLTCLCLLPKQKALHFWYNIGFFLWTWLYTLHMWYISARKICKGDIPTVLFVYWLIDERPKLKCFTTSTISKFDDFEYFDPFLLGSWP